MSDVPDSPHERRGDLRDEGVRGPDAGTTPGSVRIAPKDRSASVEIPGIERSVCAEGHPTNAV